MQFSRTHLARLCVGLFCFLLPCPAHEREGLPHRPGDLQERPDCYPRFLSRQGCFSTCPHPAVARIFRPPDLGYPRGSPGCCIGGRSAPRKPGATALCSPPGTARAVWRLQLYQRGRRRRGPFSEHTHHTAPSPACASQLKAISNPETCRGFSGRVAGVDNDYIRYISTGVRLSRNIRGADK